MKLSCGSTCWHSFAQSASTRILPFLLQRPQNSGGASHATSVHHMFFFSPFVSLLFSFVSLSFILPITTRQRAAHRSLSLPGASTRRTSLPRWTGCASILRIPSRPMHRKMTMHLRARPSSNSTTRPWCVLLSKKPREQHTMGAKENGTTRAAAASQPQHGPPTIPSLKQVLQRELQALQKIGVSVASPDPNALLLTRAQVHDGACVSYTWSCTARRGLRSTPTYRLRLLSSESRMRPAARAWPRPEERCCSLSRKSPPCA